MARITSYVRDKNITDKDILVGSSYQGEGQRGPIYQTRNYSLEDLAVYFGSNSVLYEGAEYNLNLIDSYVTANTAAIATLDQSLTVLTNDVLAQATFQTNLSATFGTFDENGNLTSLSESFANQVLQTTSSDRYANAQFVTNLASEVGTFDANGNLVTLSTSFADQILTTTTTDRFATSEFATNLGSSFGTVGEDGTVTISENFANSVLTTANTDSFALASDVTTLEASVGNIPLVFQQNNEPSVNEPVGSLWFDTNDGNKRYILQGGSPPSWVELTDGEFSAFKSSATDSLTTLADENSATANKLTNLNSVLQILDANGNLQVATQADYFEDITTYVDTNSASAEIARGLNSVFNITDANGNVIKNLATFQEEVSTYVDSDLAVTSTFNSINTQVGNNAAAIQTESTARADADSAISQLITTLTATVDGNTANVSTNANAIVDINGNLEASYGIETDVNGNVASLRLMSDGTTSEIAFRSDTFKIYNGTSTETIFSLDAGQLKLDVPLNGVSGTFSGDLSAAGGTFSGNLSAAGGTFSGDLSAAGGTFSGNLSAAGGTFNGTLQVGSGNGQITIGASGISVGSGNFAIDAAGNATFAGDITGASGTFEGSLDVGTVSIDNGYMTMQSNSATLEGTIQFVDSGDVYSSSIYASNTANQRGVNMYSADKSVISATNGASIELNGDTFTADPGHVNIYSTNGTNINGGPTTVIDLKVVGDVLQPNSPFYNNSDYQVLPGGLIIQWVRITASGNVSGTWPTQFPNFFLGAVVSTSNQTSTYATENNAKTASGTTTNYYVDMNESYNTNAFVIGFGY